MRCHIVGGGGGMGGWWRIVGCRVAAGDLPAALAMSIALVLGLELCSRSEYALSSQIQRAVMMMSEGWMHQRSFL